MKKLTCIFLAIILIFTSMPLFASAANEKETPMIYVPGYCQTDLYYTAEDGSKTKIWIVDLVDAVVTILLDTVGIVDGLGYYFFNGDFDMEPLVARVGPKVIDFIEYLKVDENGNSVHNVGPLSTEPEQNSFSYLNEKGLLTFTGPSEATEKYTDNANCFLFNFDWRKSNVDIAKELDEYIQKVKKYTGSDKVLLTGSSHGGEIVGTYLNFYGNKGDVKKVAMDSPALCGVDCIYELLSYNLDLRESNALEFLSDYVAQFGVGLEENLSVLFKYFSLDFVDDFMNCLFKNYFGDFLVRFGSFMDLLPTEHYEEIKELYKGKIPQSVIEKSDIMHYTVMENYADSFNKAKNSGTDFMVCAGYNLSSISGNHKETTDVLIDTASLTGAKAAPFGFRFSDGYKTDLNDKNIRCADITHNHISPDMQIDASCAFLPENTWFIRNEFHAMFGYSKRETELICDFLFTDKIKDVHSSPDYPQFINSISPLYKIDVRFDKSVPGYLSSQDSTLLVTNLSANSEIELYKISINGADFTADPSGITLKPGETARIPIKGSIPNVDMKAISVDVLFCKQKTFKPLNSRTVCFTVKNGKTVSYDESTPYTALKTEGTAVSLIKDFGVRGSFKGAKTAITSCLGYAADVIKAVVTLSKNGIGVNIKAIFDR